MPQTQLVITYDDITGNVNVNGPINNKGVCYLMLECARDAIKDNLDRAPQPVVVQPQNGQPQLEPFIRKAIRKRR